MNNIFQPISSQYLALLNKLLSVDFPGVEQLRLQLQDLYYRPVDDDGCIKFKVNNLISASVIHNIPVEATFSTGHGLSYHVPKAHILLHINDDGLMKELEFYTDEPDVTYQLPGPDEILVEPYSEFHW